MVLLVAATELELCGHAGLVCGVGPVEAAARTATALAADRDAAVLHVGIGGADRSAGIPIGSLVVGHSAYYEDLLTGLSPDIVHAAPELVAEAARALRAPTVRIGTSARVGGVHACPVEAMEGFAVLRAAELAGVPAVEVRAISNYVDDEREAWKIDEALASLSAALPRLLAALGE
jgi:nucleoside phosphorylase